MRHTNALKINMLFFIIVVFRMVIHYLLLPAPELFIPPPPPPNERLPPELNDEPPPELNEDERLLLKLLLLLLYEVLRFELIFLMSPCEFPKRRDAVFLLMERVPRLFVRSLLAMPLLMPLPLIRVELVRENRLSLKRSTELVQCLPPPPPYTG